MFDANNDRRNDKLDISIANNRRRPDKFAKEFHRQIILLINLINFPDAVRFQMAFITGSISSGL